METTMETTTAAKTKTCACGEIVAVEGEPKNRILGTSQGRDAWWYGCTRRGHEGQTVAFGGYLKDET